MCDEKIFSAAEQMLVSKSKLLGPSEQDTSAPMEVDRVCNTMKERGRKVASKVEEEEVRLVVRPRIFGKETEK